MKRSAQWKSLTFLITFLAISSAFAAEDQTPPVLREVLLDARRLHAPGVVNVSVRGDDDDSGIANVSGYFEYRRDANERVAPRIYFTCKATDSGGMNWSGQVTVAALAPKGVWKLRMVQLIDVAHNAKLYTDKDSEIADVSFTVQ